MSELTKQQRRVLRAVSRGQRLDSIEGIGYETARTHLKAAMKRLGVHTAAHAASRAILRGLI